MLCGFTCTKVITKVNVSGPTIRGIIRQELFFCWQLRHECLRVHQQQPFKFWVAGITL